MFHREIAKKHGEIVNMLLGDYFFGHPMHDYPSPTVIKQNRSPQQTKLLGNRSLTIQDPLKLATAMTGM